MIRKIIKIDEEKCNGCGLCASACHDGAIDIIDEKAKLVRENFCDGLGDCLPNCPTGAITFEEREAPAYDEAAVKAAQEKAALQNAAPSQGGKPMSVEDIMKIEDETKRKAAMLVHMEAGGAHQHPTGGCPGSRMMQFKREEAAAAQPEAPMGGFRPVSRLNQWPCQIKLVPTQAPFFDGAKLLIAADCTAYAYANMHEEFMKGKITVIGCPKLDDVDYTDKLTAIIRDNDIKSVTIVRMEVPCCGGLQRAAENALKASGKFIPWQVVTISRDGHIL
jgi:NAD-dependent dihydropyrimidine dehydrogenase PreA subunit